MKKSFLTGAALVLMATSAHAVDPFGVPPGIWCVANENPSRDIWRHYEKRPDCKKFSDDSWLELKRNGDYTELKTYCRAVGRMSKDGYQDYRCKGLWGGKLSHNWKYASDTGLLSLCCFEPDPDPPLLHIEGPIESQSNEDWCRDYAHEQTTFSEMYETYWKGCMYWREQGMTPGGK
jgi:hypothetical protein